MHKLMIAIVVGLIATIASFGTATAGATLDAVRTHDVLTCGVNTGLAGFAQPDSKGLWTGLDVDTCKAVAAAILGSPDKAKFVPLNAQQRFPALQSGEIDLLTRNTTWTLPRDSSAGFNFAPVTYYDGQGFMVKKSLGLKSAKELSGATICVQQGTTTELNLADYFRANKLDLKPLVFVELAEAEQAFFADRCDAYSTDASGLASTRTAKAGNPDDYMILPERISKEPLAPVVRHGDDAFFDIVKWVVYALIEAEERGVTQANVDEMKVSEDPNIMRLIGTTPGMGEALGLDLSWALRAIKAVGNYGEIFERNVGAGSPLKLERGLNALWTNGGLMYAMPIR
ncbi:MAG: amino acid ABC transporter substrate-binding protein [Alphaproteobacteria bacterium]|nr:amino acid ABC transporter substrate-binding protein [Alphaproteobacteria bacterium]